MNLRRINTIILHSWYHLSHSLETVIDLFWYSTIQIIVFGFVALYFNESGNSQATIILLGLFFWEIVQVGQYSISIGALWEIWSRSFSNLFITPLTLTEFLIGQMISGFIKSIAVFVLMAIVGIVFYNFSVFNLGLLVLSISFLELLVFSWAAGLFILGIIFRYGRSIQSLAWSLIFLIQPISAVFYPVDVLPKTLQKIAFTIPTTYIFEVIRLKFASGRVEWNYLAIATILNLVYFVLSFWYIQLMFNRSKETGDFARMES